MGDPKEPIGDLELVAALIDGRLEGEERDDTLAKVVADPALYEVFVQAQQMTESVEETSPRAGIGADRDETGAVPRPAWWRTWLPLAAAALVVLAVGLQFAGLLGPPRGFPESAGEIAGIVAPSHDAALPDGWRTHGWAVVRGEGAAMTGSESRASARAGVHLVDLAVALDRDDAGDLQAIAAALAHQLGGLPLGAVAEESLEPFLTGEATACVPAPCPAAERRVALSRLEEAVAAVAEPGALVVGRWAEAVRLAALAGERRAVAAWLASPPEGWQRSLVELGIDPGEAASPLATVGGRVAGQSPEVADLDGVARAAGELIARF